jgi:hypothetical protein
VSELEEIPANKPNSGLASAWIAPRRSPVRVRLAPLAESLQIRVSGKLGLGRRRPSTLVFGPISGPVAPRTVRSSSRCIAISCGFEGRTRLSRGDSVEHFLSARVFEPGAAPFKRRDLYEVQRAALFLETVLLSARPNGPKEGVLVAGASPRARARAAGGIARDARVARGLTRARPRPGRPWARRAATCRSRGRSGTDQGGRAGLARLGPPALLCRAAAFDL